MKVYQNLEKLQNDESARQEFVKELVQEHKGCERYRVARDAEAYYAKRNITILNYQKMLRTATGEAVKDVWSSNYKLTHGFFRQFVLQQVQYVLSNGVTFGKNDTKDKLGTQFDNRLQDLAKKACVDGVAFGFWNYDHLEVFSFADTPNSPGFAPLYDQDTRALRAGVRYWSFEDGTKRWTLYEPDGLTEYIQRDKEKMMVLQEKQPYKRQIKRTEADGIVDVIGENYPGFPIIPIYANDLQESELIGIRPSIDCYDFIMSGMANNIDETSAFYWVLKGTGGMEDADLVNFVNRMKQLHAVVLDRGVDAQANTLAVPVDANKMLLDYLKDDMYENSMLMNPAKALSGNMTATAIRLSYQQQDDKCGDFEYCIRSFIANLLKIVGVEDEPSFKWNRIANQTEETQMVMTAAEYLDDEAVLNHLPWLTPEEVKELLKRKAAEELDRTITNQPPNETQNQLGEGMNGNAET